MTAWTILNSLVSGTAALAALGMLLRFKPRYTFMERIGLSLMAGAGILRVHVVLMQRESPFWDWAPTLMVFGLALFLAGRGWRDLRHDLANRRQIKASEAWMKGRG